MREPVDYCGWLFLCWLIIIATSQHSTNFVIPSVALSDTSQHSTNFVIPSVALSDTSQHSTNFVIPSEARNLRVWMKRSGTQSIRPN
jgi:hypothetical protein